MPPNTWPSASSGLMIVPASSTALSLRTISEPVARSISTTAAYAPEPNTISDSNRVSASRPPAAAAARTSVTGAHLLEDPICRLDERGATHRHRAAGERAHAGRHLRRIAETHLHLPHLDPEPVGHDLGERRLVPLPVRR